MTDPIEEKNNFSCDVISFIWMLNNLRTRNTYRTTNGMELHHLKVTQGKLWNGKIKNNNKIHMLHHLLL